MSGKRLVVLGGAVLVLLAIVVAVSARGDVAGWFGGGASAGSGTAVERGTAPADSVASSPASDAGHLTAFREFVMIDREREPEWMAQVTRVTFADSGELTAETTLPGDWRDSTTRTRPAESICTQLFAYAQRGVKRPWTTISVLASDGAALVTRTATGNTCRQQ